MQEGIPKAQNVGRDSWFFLSFPSTLVPGTRESVAGVGVAGNLCVDTMYQHAGRGQASEEEEPVLWPALEAISLT